MAASTMFAMVAFNLLWYALRRLGLRAFFSRQESATVPVG
jgi:Na+/serine symporter